jgi:polysaccharide export outer membrane protein
VEVTGYNSKVYYVIYDGGGAGQQVARMPITGNETVLDAVSQLAGLPVVSDAKRIWISRPAPAGCSCFTMPVDWHAITECADTRTNYQILPGDRVFVKAYRMTEADNTLARVLAPIERLFGVTLLGTSTVRAINGDTNGGFFP